MTTKRGGASHNNVAAGPQIVRNTGHTFAVFDVLPPLTRRALDEAVVQYDVIDFAQIISNMVAYGYSMADADYLTAREIRMNDDHQVMAFSQQVDGSPHVRAGATIQRYSEGRRY